MLTADFKSAYIFFAARIFRILHPIESAYVQFFKAELALTSDGFTDIDFATLASVIARETLNCKETVVFAAAMAWGKAMHTCFLYNSPNCKHIYCSILGSQFNVNILKNTLLERVENFGSYLL
jgi:hypothetical protein